MSANSEVRREEFQRLLEPLLERAGGYAFSIVGNREDAEDAVQEAALKAYRNLARFDRALSFKGWWFAIIRNCCLDLLRKRRTRAETAMDESEGIASAESAAWEAAERGSEVGRAVAQLNREHREILRLRYYGDCSYAEIAAALAIPMGTVMSRLHAARQALATVYRRENQ